MKQLLFILLILVSLVSCEQFRAKKDTKLPLNKKIKSEKIIIANELSATKAQIVEVLGNSKTTIRRFAKSNDWEGLSTDIYYDSVVIFADKSEFNKTYDLLNNKKNRHSPTECVVLVERTLLCMSPDYVNEHSPFSDQKNHFEKYINYILAKALYMNIVYGEEALAGPVWFREAFALYAAGLYLNEDIEFTSEKLISIVRNPTKHKSDDYTMLMKYIDQNGDIKRFVEIAGQNYLTDSLVSFIEVNFSEDVKENNGN